MITLPIISIIFCFAYIFFIVFKYNVPTSISETYYLLPNKWDWMFSAWCVLTAVPTGIYWFTISPNSLKWIPIVVCIALCLIGVSCRYKSGPKNPDNIVRGNMYYSVTYSKSKSFIDFIKELLKKFSPKEFLKYGWARPIHYISSLVAIILTFIYLCKVNILAIPSIILSMITFIIIGLNVDGTYNEMYSADVDNKSWIFFMEVVSFINLYVFLWTTL